MITKQEQRKLIKEVLKNTSITELNRQSELASKRLIELIQFKEANTILAYMAMKRECDPRLIVEKANELGIAVAFPLCIEGNRIKICVPFGPDCFNIGAYGIIEPDENRSAILSPNDLDLIIVPGLAFDNKCNRLGRGAGYYDRLLCESRAYKVGLAFDCQLLPEVSTEAHDQKLDCVVSSNNIYYKK